jgi:methionyl aminopeptidase
MIILKSQNEIAKMKAAGRLVAGAHQLVKKMIRPGLKTIQLDRAVADYFTEYGAVPSFLGYQGYPASICASINEQVVHGIPGDTVLQEGDIVGIDIGVILDGYQGDSAWTYPVGDISEDAARLLKVTEQALWTGIAQAKDGGRLSDISHAIQCYVEAAGFSVVRDLVGHGIGKDMHEPPQIPNYGPPGRGPKLKKGMTLAIEPMVNIGGYDVEILSDHWTIVTKDRSLSAHFEHTIAITEDEPLVLTTFD